MAVRVPSDPRIVFIGENQPYGAVCGGGLRTRVTLDALRTVGRVRFLPITRRPWSAEAVAHTARILELAPTVRYDAGGPAQVLTRLRRNLSPRCMDTDGFCIRDVDRHVVEQELAHADLVWIHHLRCANMLGRWCWPRGVLDVDDLLSRFESAKAVVSRRGERFRALWRAWQWRRRETLLDERFRHLIVCSEDDRRYLRAQSRVHVIPNTFDDSHVIVRRNPTVPPRFGFIGHLGYQPNRDAVEWFGRFVWPEIERVLPHAELRLIGDESSELLRTRGLPGVALGYVADPTEEMATWTAMIIPVRFGGGTRIKISEAFVRRIPIVSTRLGAFGYDVKDGRELLLVDDAGEFARACIRIFKEPGLAERLTAAGSELYRTRYSVEAVRQRLVAVAREALHQESGTCAN